MNSVDMNMHLLKGNVLHLVRYVENAKRIFFFFQSIYKKIKEHVPETVNFVMQAPNSMNELGILN